MKKTQWIALFRNIKKTFVSFISIVIFVALGVAIFLGIRWNELALAEKTDSYLGERNYHDFQIAFAYGFTNDDLQAISATDCVTDVEGAYSVYGTTEFSGENYVLAVQSLTERIDVANALEGVMPVAPDEIGIERMFAQAVGLKIGDKFTIDSKRGGTSLIIMRINGFSTGKVKRYLYRDNILLTILGIVSGVFAGIGFSQWMLAILQKSGDNFYTAPNPWVCLAAAGLAALFSLITNLMAALGRR